MNVLNYHPEVIEKEFEELKMNIESSNSIAKKKFKNKLKICITLFFVFCAASVFAICSIDTSNIVIGIVTIVASVVSSAACCVDFIFFVGILVDGPDVQSLSFHKTFAMEFHDIYSQANVLNIEIDEEARHCIMVSYENDNHIVRTRRLSTRGILMSTEITEKILDVGRGYILQPYNIGDKPKIIN